MNEKNKRFWGEQFVRIKRIYWGLNFFVSTAEFISYFSVWCAALWWRETQIHVKQTNVSYKMKVKVSYNSDRKPRDSVPATNQPTNTFHRFHGPTRRQNTFALPSGLLPFVFSFSLSLSLCVLRNGKHLQCQWVRRLRGHFQFRIDTGPFDSKVYLNRLRCT